MISLTSSGLINFFLHVFSCGHKDIAAARLENVTQTITRILEGYDIRLRPNFGGMPILMSVHEK